MKEPIVTIEKLAFGGSGIGHVDGKVCFIPCTAPGDTARVRVVSEKRSYMEAELIELLAPSPARVHPPCPVFGACGGCNWQHLAYSEQLAAKQEIFTDLLRRSAQVNPERILPIIPSPRPFGYRSRIQLKVRYIEGALHLGFYRTGTHFIVDLPQECAIALPAVNRIATGLVAIIPASPDPGRIPQVDVVTGDDDSTIVIFHYIGTKQRELTAFLRQHAGLANGVYVQSGRKKTLTRIAGIDSLSYRVPPEGSAVPERVLTFAPGGFSQVNYSQNLALINTVFAWAGLTGSERVLDLYCGNGNLSIPLAHAAATVAGMEDYETSISDAARNCSRNGIKNASYQSCDAAAGTARLKQAGERFDVVILDPPRTGAAELVGHIPGLHPDRILYVSCDPATLARDIAILGRHGYPVTKSVPVDMFPQTYHIESVTLFERE